MKCVIEHSITVPEPGGLCHIQKTEEVAQILSGPFVTTIDNSPLLPFYLCKREDGTLFYVEAVKCRLIEPDLSEWTKTSGQLIFYNEWAEFRKEAAKAAMEGILSGGAEGWGHVISDERTPHQWPYEIAQFAISCADSLITQLKKRSND